MIRKIKKSIFRVGNIVKFNEEKFPNHMCAGMHLRIENSCSKSQFFSATVVKVSNNGKFFVGRREDYWTKSKYVQA